jgi:hypothetical protein
MGRVLALAAVLAGVVVVVAGQRKGAHRIWCSCVGCNGVQWSKR